MKESANTITWKIVNRFCVSRPAQSNVQCHTMSKGVTRKTTAAAIEERRQVPMELV
jgi:hypothetical protein